MKQLMIDIETLDTRPTAKIVQIGWCIAPLPEQVIHSVNELTSGSIPVTPVGQELLGLTESKDTLDWWQNDEGRRNALRELADQGLPLHDALLSLGQVVAVHQPAEVWCKGASFDFAILSNAYAAHKIGLPWHRRQERCLRTLGTFTDPGYVNEDVKYITAYFGLTAHDGRDDAIAQAIVLSRILEQILPLD